MFESKQKYCNTYVTDKVVISGEKLEKYSYSVPIMCDYEREHTPQRDSANAENGKREDNLSRARQTVRRIIWQNMTPHTKFLTLTCEDICLDKKVFMRRLTTFFQAMSRQGYDLRYLYVLERQLERGRKEGNAGTIHAHIVVFNDEKIPLKVLKKAWKHGRTEIHILNELRYKKTQDGYKRGEKVNDVGAYVSKYITKGAELEWGARCFNCSVGLDRPTEFSLKAYGAPDIGYLHDPEDPYFIMEQEFTKMTQFTFRGSKMVSYDMGGTEIHQIIDYAQGKFKNTQHAVQHSDFMEITTDE